MIIRATSFSQIDQSCTWRQIERQQIRHLRKCRFWLPPLRHSKGECQYSVLPFRLAIHRNILVIYLAIQGHLVPGQMDQHWFMEIWKVVME